MKTIAEVKGLEKKGKMQSTVLKGTLTTHNVRPRKPERLLD
jgi:hypothetical protein